MPGDTFEYPVPALFTGASWFKRRAKRVNRVEEFKLEHYYMPELGNNAVVTNKKPVEKRVLYLFSVKVLLLNC